MPAPEDVVAIAKVRVLSSVQHVDDGAQETVAEAADAGDVVAPAALGEPRPLREVSAVEERPDEARDLARVGGAVCVDHGDDVPGRRREAAGQSVSLAPAGLHDNTDIRAHCAGDGKRIVNGVAIDHDHFVNVRWHAGKNVGQIAGFIQCRDDHGNPRPHLVIRLNSHTNPLSSSPIRSPGTRESAPGLDKPRHSSRYS